MARPSSTADTIVEKLSSARTISEADFATAVPDPMAIPISAFFSAGASFTPSPVFPGRCYKSCHQSKIIPMFLDHRKYQPWLIFHHRLAKTRRFYSCGQVQLWQRVWHFWRPEPVQPGASRQILSRCRPYPRCSHSLQRCQFVCRWLLRLPGQNGGLL